MIKSHILIIGGGVSSLFIAYSLVKRGVNSITIVEKDYIGSGSTSKCATGIRASFTSEEHVILMKHSINLWRKYTNSELGVHGLYFDQSGYIWLASKIETIDMFRKLVKFHNSLGVPTRVIDLDELREKVPPIRTSSIIGAMFDPIAGKSHPFDTIFALYKVLRSRGVRIHVYTRVEKIITKDMRVTSVKTSRGLIETDILIVAAGSNSHKLLKPLGLDIPVKNIPRHILVTEAYKQAFKPLVIDWDTPGVPYIVQTRDGNFLISRNIEEEPEISLYSQRIDFMAKAVKPIVRFFPWLKNVRILRYWIGYYTTTPDHHPIYGPVGDYENLYIATGFSGHGYMMGPITGEVIAEWIIDGKPSIPQAARLTLERFRKGLLIKEIAIVG